jgi:ABC-type sugar transport system ATPase subunit
MGNIMNKKEKILFVKNISKEFPGVKALSNFNFELLSGEVHCIVGENGAGKSTFIKILSGAFMPNSGQIYIDQHEYNFLTPNQARQIGIQTVYQEDILVPSISAAENIFLGSEKIKQKFFINYRKIFKEAQKLTEQLGIELDVTELYENLSPPDQQFVKILKALAKDPKVLILDEPTQAFNIKDIELVTRMAKRISNEGVGVIYIGHNLEEIIDVADRITILRDGQKIATHDKAIEGIDTQVLAKEMVGRPVELFYQKKEHEIGDYIFEIKDLKLNQHSKPINFKVRKGEILGVAGLKGSGRTEIARAIYGSLSKYRGKVLYNNKEITPENPKQAVNSGLALLTEDKKIDGLFMGMSVAQNITLVGLDEAWKFFINLRQERNLAEKFVERLNIKTPSLDQEVQFLSGGNQQKVVIAKWLFKGVNILIVDEPTHGIDVNAKVEVYRIFTELTASGKSIIMISSEMPEIISISDRVIVVRNYEISKELVGDEITEENILSGFMEGG